MYHVFIRGIYRQHLKDRIWIGSFSSCFFYSFTFAALPHTLLILIYLRSLTFMCEFISYLNSFFFCLVLAMLFWVLRSILISKQAIMPYTFFIHSRSLFLLINFKMWNFFSNWILLFLFFQFLVYFDLTIHCAFLDFDIVRNSKENWRRVQQSIVDCFCFFLYVLRYFFQNMQNTIFGQRIIHKSHISLLFSTSSRVPLFCLYLFWHKILSI